MHLYCEEDLHDGTRGKKVDLMGEIEFELTDFLSDKIKKREFYKYFSGSLSKIPILSWGVKFTIGIVPSNPQDFSDCIDDDDELEVFFLLLKKLAPSGKAFKGNPKWITRASGYRKSFFEKSLWNLCPEPILFRV